MALYYTSPLLINITRGRLRG